MSDRLTARLDELAALPAGWLDGEGLAPTPHAIATARAVLGQLAAGHPEASRPYVYPTPEGEVSAEWVLGRVEADVRFPAQAGPLLASAVHADTGAEREAAIDPADPVAAAAALAAWLRGAAAL